MTTAGSAVPGSQRHQRRLARRRLRQDRIVAVVVLLVAFGIAVAVLAMQWLDTGKPAMMLVRYIHLSGGVV